MIEIALVFICLVLAVSVGFCIPALIELRRVSSQLTAFLKSTEGSLNSTLREVEDTMKSFREVTDNISSVTQDAKDFSSSLVGLADDVKSVGDSIHNLTSRTSRNVSGIRAGISAALEILLENLITRKGGKNA